MRGSIKRMVHLTVDQIKARYTKYGLWLLAALFAAGMIYDSINGISVQWNLVVSVIYSLVMLFAYGACWKGVAKTSPGNLAKFYMAGSVLRMMSALLVVVVYCFVVRQFDSIMRFVVYFLVFYVAMLVYNVVYFTQVEKTINKEN